VVDSTYLLPSLGISVKNLRPKDIELINKLREHIEYSYPTPLLAELVGKAAREASKRDLKILPEEAVEGFRALLAGVGVTVELPEPDGLALAAELWIRGHRDIMDNIAYAHAVKTRGYFMTMDKAFTEFLTEKGYFLDAVITHENLESIVKKSD